jgi:hypothetical protein
MFKSHLKDAEEIALFIYQLSNYSINEEFVSEYFTGCKAILKSAPVERLFEGDRNHNIRSPKKENFYYDLPIKTMPPLIVENNVVVDGNHRLRILKKKKIKRVLIYDIISI